MKNITIQKAIATAKQSYFKPDILVVDAYSSDKTKEWAIRVGATVIQQLTQLFPGKGLAMKAGLEESIRSSSEASADIILFLDSNIRNLTSEWVDNLARAVVNDNRDMSRDFIQGTLEMRRSQS